MPRAVLSRRTVLRGALGGAAVSLALPPLEAMLGRGLGFSAPPPPRRFGIWFWGNGVRLEHWIPQGTGTSWTPREELAPLADLKPYLNVLTGLEVKTATHPHHSGMAGILTGAPFLKLGTTRDTIVSTFATKSIDQVAADHLGGKTRFRSLEVGICRFRGSDEGTTFQHLSHNGPNNVNPSEYSPARLFQRLFGALPRPELAAARRSVLDLVVQQAASLRATLGPSDRRRLEQHMESVRAVEKRLRQAEQACAPPPPARDVPDVNGQEQIEQQNQIMTDLLALALVCDLCRVFSVLFSTCGSGVIIWQVGARNGLHQICHDEPLPQPTVHRATVFTMQQLGYFLRKLRDTQELGGNLLDSCSILCTTELCEGNRHNNDEFPILVAGRAGGRLRTGLHYRSPNRENASKVLLTVLRAAGVPLTEFGTAGGHVDSGLSAIEA
ncbi:MAG: DUF1552 domain-containing protein [Myxococcales bacterium]|nr:DUF1552 domain-containing protein [Myxococcota bacterium]MDW8282219.1 DUF1552 domain-containing protein [Myxococcales bacterium]